MPRPSSSPAPRFRPGWALPSGVLLIGDLPWCVPLGGYPGSQQIPIGMHGWAVTGDPSGRGPRPDPVRCELPQFPPRIEVAVFLHVQRMINEIVPDEPDPAAANALQEGLG